MDARLKSICGLLQHDEPMRRWAAAIVLAELAPADAEVTHALGAALPGANAMLTAAILDAFAAIGGKAALPYLIPLLDAEDLAIKLRAITAITRAGAAALPAVLPLLEGATPTRMLVLVDILARIPSAEAMRALVDRLPTADAALSLEIAEAVRRYAPGMTTAQRGGLHQVVARFMEGKAVRDSERMQGACLLVIGALGRPEARAILVRGMDPGQPPRLRVQALRALQHLEWTPAAARTVVARVQAALGDGDADVAQQALRLLSALPAATLTTAQWRALMNNPLEAVRALALARLMADDSSAGTRALLDLLRHEDGQVQESAAGALARRTGAGAALLEALLAETNMDRTWRLAKILKPHAAALEPRLRARLAQQAARELQGTTPRGDALLYLLRQADAAAADGLLREAAFGAMKAKRWAQAVEIFRKLVHSAAFDDASRYALSLCNLKLSPKELAPHVRAEDFALRGLQALRRQGGPALEARLLKEKILDADDFHYVGFHFSEMTGDERAFGEALLRHVRKTWPRTPAGKAAKAKLGVAEVLEAPSVRERAPTVAPVRAKGKRKGVGGR